MPDYHDMLLVRNLWRTPLGGLVVGGEGDRGAKGG